MPVDDLKAFTKTHEIPYPIALDGQSGVAQKYGIRGTPTTFLIDTDSKVAGGAQGPRQWDSEAAKELIRLYLR